MAERYRVGGAGGEGADSRRAVRGDGLASQARGAGAGDQPAIGPDDRGGSAADLRRCHQGCAGGAVGGVRSDLRQAAQGDDPDAAAGAGAARPAEARPGRSRAGAGVSAATIDRLLVDTKIAAAGGKRRRVGFYSAIRREVPIRTFNDWNDPPPGFCEIDMVAHGGTAVAGSFIQTLTMVDVATGWTECLPLVTREGSLVVEAMERAQSLFPWLIRGADFDNDSAFMNDVVVPWCRAQKIEVTRSRAYKKNDQAFVEQKNGAVVRRLVGYGRFDGDRDGAHDGASLCGGSAARELLPAVVQAEGEAARGREGDQALSCSGDAL